MLTNAISFFIFCTTNIVVTTNNGVMTQTAIVEAHHVVGYEYEGTHFTVTNVVPCKEQTSVRVFKPVTVWQEIPLPPPPVSPFPIQAGEGVILEQTPSNIVIKTVPMPYIQQTNYLLHGINTTNQFR